jgi:hypothetical protein
MMSFFFQNNFISYIEKEVSIQFAIVSIIVKFDSLKYRQNQIFYINIVSFILILKCILFFLFT